MESFEPYFKAGEIACKARRLAESIVKEGVSVLKVCEKVEDFIRNRGGEPAFPCNVCINDVAAHYTAEPDDPLKIPSSSIVKVDLGVHIDGYIVDTAVTVVLNDKFIHLKEAAEEALRRALKAARADVNVHELSRAIFETARLYGLNPIRNLSGHEIARFNLHAGLSIPNIPSSGGKLKLHRVYAIEPFVTEPQAKGLVLETGNPTIYRCSSYKRIKDKYADELLKALWVRFKGLPFTERWFKTMNLKPEIRKAWSRVKSFKTVKGYRVLRESSGGLVAQAEESIIITEDGFVGLTGFPV